MSENVPESDDARPDRDNAKFKSIIYAHLRQRPPELGEDAKRVARAMRVARALPTAAWEGGDAAVGKLVANLLPEADEGFSDDERNVWSALEQESELDHAWPSERNFLHLTKFNSPKRLYRALDGLERKRVYVVERTATGKRRSSGAWRLLKRQE